MKDLTLLLDRPTSVQNTVYSYHRSQEMLPKFSSMPGVFILPFRRLAHWGRSLFKVTISCSDLEQHFFSHWTQPSDKLTVPWRWRFQSQQNPGVSEKLRFQILVFFRQASELAGARYKMKLFSMATMWALCSETRTINHAIPCMRCLRCLRLHFHSRAMHIVFKYIYLLYLLRARALNDPVLVKINFLALLGLNTYDHGVTYERGKWTLAPTQMGQNSPENRLS